MSKSSHEHHNSGQTDGSNGTYSPPHSAANEFASFVGVYHKDFSEVHSDNAAYRAGQDNAKK